MKDIFRGLLFLGLSILTIKVLSGNEPYMLHSVNLIFHEAGHPIFSLFGEFIGFIGGTIGQLFFPAIFAVYFLKQKDLFATSIMVWWLGQNLLDISIYVSDARTQGIQLIGGSHDWAYILGRTNLLTYDQVIGNAVFFVGISLMIFALVYALITVLRPYYKMYSRR